MFNVTLFTKEIKPVEIGKTVAKVLLVVAQLLLVVAQLLLVVAQLLLVVAQLV